jgi:valyl-tRNA synthetase
MAEDLGEKMKPVEGKWYRFWQESGFFSADSQSERPKFSSVF